MYVHAELGTITKMLHDDLRQIMDGEKEFRDTIFFKLLNMPFEHRLTQDRKHRFRSCIGEWPQARAQSAGSYDSLLDHKIIFHRDPSRGERYRYRMT